MQKTLAVMVLLTWAVACSPVPRTTTSSVSPQSIDDAPGVPMKGYELYSFRSDTGDWYYTILTGTNRSKRADEVTAAAVKGVAALAAQVKALTPSAQVFWSNRLDSASAQSLVGLAYPPPATIDAIKALFTASNLDLVVSPA